MIHETIDGVEPGTLWVRVDPTSPVYGWKLMSQDAYDEWLRNIGLNSPAKYPPYTLKPQEIIETRPGRCECGSEAAGSLRHSTWCPAFEK